MIQSNLIPTSPGLEPELPAAPDVPDPSGEPQPEPPAGSEPDDDDETEIPTGPNRPRPFKKGKRYNMVLNNLNQKELDRSVDLLITNGPLSEIQTLIEPVGYGLEGLQRLADGLYDWRANQTATTMKMLSQKQAREQRDELRDLVDQLVSSFCRTAKAIFKAEPVVLRALNLQLRRSSKKGSVSNGTTEVEANGNGSTPKPKEDRSLTACVTDARKLFTNALELDEVYQQRLAEAGWDTDRLNEALEQVNALVASDNKRQEAAAARRKQQTVARESEGALRNDYKEARELIKVAIDEADLDNEDEIKKLIGL